MSERLSKETLGKWENFMESQKHWANGTIPPSPTQSSPTQSSTNGFPSLLPIAMKIAAQTIGGASDEELKEFERKIKVENRRGKLDSVLNGTKFVERKLEDDEEYRELLGSSLVSVKPMSTPTGNLFYVDYQYGGVFEKNLDNVITASQSQSSS
jgi:hypothetical protein